MIASFLAMTVIALNSFLSLLILFGSFIYYRTTAPLAAIAMKSFLCKPFFGFSSL
ncbi:hypothetical protein HNQ00_001056 [Flavobacterium sp. 14A]|nr:hypothetical protein [Flavobacterium sp. 14A]